MATNGASGSPKAEYRQLGKSGLRVSVPILGAMSIGDPRWMEWVADEEKVRKSGPVVIIDLQREADPWAVSTASESRLR